MPFSEFNAALESAQQRINVFFRDDDAGWADAELATLLDVFAAQRAPIDLAVIPQALTRELAVDLCARRALARERLGLHQHGYAHTNHETKGRKCEFGPARGALQQTRDVLAGQLRLQALLGRIDAIFTPPWNRCSQATVQALGVSGLKVLSRDAGADSAALAAGASALELGRLQACPVHVDWCKWTNIKAPDWPMLDRQLARAAASGEATLGVMLHHAVMRDADWQALRELLTLLRRHPRVRLCLMRELVSTPRATGASRAAA